MVGITLWQACMGLTGVALGLLGALTYVYAKNLRAVWSPFGLGLLVFALLFLGENAVSLWAIHSWSAYYGPNIAFPILVIKLAEVAGFSALLAISWG